MKKNKQVLVVGAGLAGSTIARVLADNKIEVKILEKRSHIAGNSFDFINSNNERIHKYGPHLLHCNKNSKALSFLNRFTEWISYEHRVRALLSDGRTTPLPINQITLEDIFNKKFCNEIEVKEFLDSIRNTNLLPSNTDELFECSVGEKLSNIFFRPYTRKMWGIEPNKLSISIGARLPVRTNKDTRYFTDEFQALPKDGYTKMVCNMIDHPLIEVCLNKNFEKGMEKDFDHSFLCVPIDKYFGYKYGMLPYRSILFENRLENTNDQKVAVINFTDNSKYTRKTQWSLLPNSPKKLNKNKTITYEIPCSMDLNPEEYYYPINTKDSNAIFKKYKFLAKNIKNISFCGRTGLFKYIDMIPAVDIHLRMAHKFVNNL
ncbi:MAG: UDP-galactopyranose mutase [Cytophagia bacterium]|nr:UDP-galactopyranose mutase [Cytophagia bacterium]|tara:strand:- start:373 stop:1497 length:1125 start_codon:yes stop_codon:yes gene_type:complete